jgi:hypothetical protein
MVQPVYGYRPAIQRPMTGLGGLAQASQQAGLARGPGLGSVSQGGYAPGIAAPAPQYGFAPTAPGVNQGGVPPGSVLHTPSDGTTPWYQLPNGQQVDVGDTTKSIGGLQVANTIDPVTGMYHDFAGGNVGMGEKFSINATPEYAAHAGLNQVANQYGAAAQGTLNDPRAQAAVGGLAQYGAPSAAQAGALGYMGKTLGSEATGLGYHTQALNMLGQAAAGAVPSAAEVQQGQGLSSALRAQLSAASSARGGAYQQGLAATQASQQSAAAQGQAIGNAAALRAQEQAQARAAYDQAAQGYSSAAQGMTSGAGGLAQAASQQQALAEQGGQAYAQASAAQQQQAMQYFLSQQQASQHQSDLEAQLAASQVANDYGLAGTALQTQTQQNIANQQNTQAYVGAGIGASAALFAALL